MAWLDRNASDLLPPEEGGRTLRVLSIGCGNGDLELALLDACPERSVHVIGLEPSDKMRMEFMESISKRSKPFRHKKKFTLSDVGFSEDNIIDNIFGNEGEEPFDLVILGQVLYYFDNASEIIDWAQQSTRADGGRVLIIHQSGEGVPEVQETATAALRNSTANMLTSSDIVAQLGSRDGMVVDQLPALLDLSEIMKGTEVGKQIMSFALEVDLRGASESVLHQCQQIFKENSSVVEHDTDGIGPPGAPGPFLREAATGIMLPGLAEAATD